MITTHMGVIMQFRWGDAGIASVTEGWASGRERLTAQGRSKRLQMGPGAAAARRPGDPEGSPMSLTTRTRLVMFLGVAIG